MIGMLQTDRDDLIAKVTALCKTIKRSTTEQSQLLLLAIICMSSHSLLYFEVGKVEIV